jgi:hypothetical protein
LFYECQLFGLGDRFIDAVEADVQSLTRCAGIHLKVDGFHRMLISRFPFALYCLVENSCNELLGILQAMFAV